MQNRSSGTENEVCLEREDPYETGLRFDPYETDPYETDPYETGLRSDPYETDPYEAGLRFDPDETDPYETVLGVDPYGAGSYKAPGGLLVGRLVESPTMGAF